MRIVDPNRLPGACSLAGCSLFLLEKLRIVLSIGRYYVIIPEQADSLFSSPSYSSSRGARNEYELERMPESMKLSTRKTLNQPWVSLYCTNPQQTRERFAGGLSAVAGEKESCLLPVACGAKVFFSGTAGEDEGFAVVVVGRSAQVLFQLAAAAAATRLWGQSLFQYNIMYDARHHQRDLLIHSNNMEWRSESCASLSEKEKGIRNRQAEAGGCQFLLRSFFLFRVSILERLMAPRRE